MIEANRKDDVTQVAGFRSDFLLVEIGRILADSINRISDVAVADEVTIDWMNGTYTGEVSNGVPHGQGIWTHPDGDKYVGEWKDNKPNGQGTFTYADGGKYVGEFKDGKINGQGTLTTPDGSAYVGEWKDGNRWQGTEYDKDANVTATYLEGIRAE